MNSIFDNQLIHIAANQVASAEKAAADAEKRAFTDAGTAKAGGDPAAAGGDPSMGGGGGAPPGVDPMAAAAAMGGGGGAPPSDPMAGGGGGALTEDRVLQLIQQSQAAGTGGMGGGMGGGMAGGGEMGPGGKPKMKIDVNTEIYHVKRLLVGLYAALGLSVPADTLLGDPAEDPYATQQEAQQDPASAAAAPGALESSIKPIAPIRGAAPGAQGAQGGAGGAPAPAAGGEKMSSLLREQGRAVPSSEVPSPLTGRAHALAELLQQSAT
jgi:hypothetical protein